MANTANQLAEAEVRRTQLTDRLQGIEVERRQAAVDLADGVDGAPGQLHALLAERSEVEAELEGIETRIARLQAVRVKADNNARIGEIAAKNKQIAALAAEHDRLMEEYGRHIVAAAEAVKRLKQQYREIFDLRRSEGLSGLPGGALGGFGPAGWRKDVVLASAFLQGSFYGTGICPPSGNSVRAIDLDAWLERARFEADPTARFEIPLPPTADDESEDEVPAAA